MSKICCFTGSRDLRGLSSSKICKKLEDLLVDLIENEGYTVFRAGGALGFDTLAALCVLHLKKKYPEIQLHLILPSKDQDKYFSAQEKLYYELTLKHADKITYIQDAYSDGVMMKRNRALVNGSDICLALLRKNSGGTYLTTQYAIKQRVKVVNLMTSL